MRRASTILAAVICGYLLMAALDAQSPVRYVYDERGRLVAVISPSGDAAVYSYDAVGNLLEISRLAAGAVSILQFSPGEGPTGTTVTIWGTGFSATPSENAVTFNTTSAAVVSASPTSLVVTVPSGAATGPIAITSPNGSTTSADAFVVGDGLSPTISGISPAIGVAGTTVTITGTNFPAAPEHNRVALNLSRSWPTAIASTSLDATVPLQVGSGRISVKTPFGTAISADDFFVPPPPYGASDVVATGRMTFGDPTNVTVGTSHKIGLFVFDAVAGSRISLKAVPGPSGGITIRGPDLSVISQAGIGVFAILLEPPLLTRSGTYSITVDPNGTSTGTTGLTLYEVPPDVSGAIEIDGAAVGVTTTVPGQNGRLTFTPADGQRLSVTLSGGPTGTVALQNEQGQVLASRTIGVLSSFIEPVTTASALPHSLFVDYSQAGTGTVTLKLFDVPPDLSGTISPDGTPLQVSIAAPGQNGAFTFSGTAAQRVSLNVSGSSPSGSVQLRNAAGQTLASVNSGTISAFMEPKTLSATETYAIRVDPGGAATGTMTLSLYDVPADLTGSATINGSSVPLTITTPGQNATVTFDGTASELVRVSVTGNTTGGVTVRLLKPDGTQLTASSSILAGFTLAQQTLPTTGTYTIVVDPTKANTGSLNVAVISP